MAHIGRVHISQSVQQGRQTPGHPLASSALCLFLSSFRWCRCSFCSSSCVSPAILHPRRHLSICTLLSSHLPSASRTARWRGHHRRWAHCAHCWPSSWSSSCSSLPLLCHFTRVHHPSLHLVQSSPRLQSIWPVWHSAHDTSCQLQASGSRKCLYCLPHWHGELLVCIAFHVCRHLILLTFVVLLILSGSCLSSFFQLLLVVTSCFTLPRSVD